jgi:serine/threonine protein kinase
MGLLEKYPGTSEEGLRVLSEMLQFNPQKRLTAEQALKDPYFDDIRIPEQEVFEEEKAAVCDVDLKIEEDRELTMEELRQLIIEEINTCPQTI